MTAPAALIGIDGGGTKTRCLVADLSGRILGEGLSGPSNYLAVGQAAAAAALRSAADAALASAGLTLANVAAACAGLAGVSRPDSVMLEALAFLAPARIQLTSDARIALEGALDGAPGAVVISGTGSIALGKNAAGEMSRAGGWGWVLGDEGSGFDIGRRALSAALAALDETGPATSLGERICTAWSLGALNQVVPRVYQDLALARPDIAGLVPVVVRAADEGDMVASGLLAQAGVELARIAVAVLRKLQLPAGQPHIVAVTGGVVTAVPAVRVAMAAAVAEWLPGARVVDSRRSPAEGALVMAAALL